MPGGAATGWEIEELNDVSNFVTLPSTTSGMGNGRLSLAYAANTMASVRQAQVEVRTTGEGRIRKDTLTLIQQAPPPQTIRLSPVLLDDIPSAGATRTLRLSFGGGATGYTAGASGGADELGKGAYDGYGRQLDDSYRAKHGDLCPQHYDNLYPHRRYGYGDTFHLDDKSAGCWADGAKCGLKSLFLG